MRRRTAWLDLYAVLGEPATWRALERPSHDVSLNAIVSANLVVPAFAVPERSA